MTHLEKWFPCGGFGSDDVDSVVHGEGKTEEANPVAMPHTARASLEMAIELGEIPSYKEKRNNNFYLGFHIVMKTKPLSEVKGRKSRKWGQNLDGKKTLSPTIWRVTHPAPSFR